MKQFLALLIVILLVACSEATADTENPTLSFDDPGELRVGEAVILSGTASDNVSVERVQVFEGTVLIGSSNSDEHATDGVAQITFGGTAWSLAWTPSAARDYSFTAVATDATGNRSEVSRNASAVGASSAVVTSTADSGPGSLRQALVNVGSGAVITFDSGLDGQTLSLPSPLVLAKDITFDASSLPNGLTLAATNTHLFEVGDAKVVFDGVDFSGGRNPNEKEGDLFEIAAATGSLRLNGSAIAGYADTAISVANLAGEDAFAVSLTDVTLDGSGSSGEALYAETAGGSSVTLTLVNSRVTNAGARAVYLVADGSGVHQVKIERSSLASVGDEALYLEVLGGALLDVRLTDDSRFTAGGTNDAVVLLASDDAQLRGLADALTFMPAESGAGLYAEAANLSALDLTLTNNLQSNTSADGLFYLFNDADAFTCADVQGNSSASAVPTTVEQESVDAFTLPDFASGSVTAYLDARNGFSGSWAFGAGSFASGACDLPTDF